MQSANKSEKDNTYAFLSSGLLDQNIAIGAMAPSSLQPTNVVATNPRDSSRSRRDEKIEPSASALPDLGSAERRLAELTGGGGSKFQAKGKGEPSPIKVEKKWKPSSTKGESSDSDGADKPAKSPQTATALSVDKDKNESKSDDKVKKEDDSGETSSDEEDEEYDEGVRSFPVEGGGKYRDYSRARLRSDPVATIFAAASSKDPTFPVKLHQILSSGEFEDVIAWLPHGRAFRVLQPKAFEERVIPLFFRHGRYASFARQVNGWGFNRITNGPDYGSYFHELFLRGCPHLCERMRRPQPGAGPRKSRKELSSVPSPNFYEISEKAPLPELPPRPEPSSSAAQAQAQAQAVISGLGGAAGAAGVDAMQQQAAAAAAQQAAAFPQMAAFGGMFPGQVAAAASAPSFFMPNMQGVAGAGGAAGGGLAAAGMNMYAAQMMGAMGGPATAAAMPGQANFFGAAGLFNPAAAAAMQQLPQQQQQQQQGQGSDAAGGGQGGNEGGAQNSTNNNNTGAQQWNGMQGGFR